MGQWARPTIPACGCASNCAFIRRTQHFALCAPWTKINLNQQFIFFNFRNEFLINLFYSFQLVTVRTQFSFVTVRKKSSVLGHEKVCPNCKFRMRMVMFERRLSQTKSHVRNLFFGHEQVCQIVSLVIYIYERKNTAFDPVLFFREFKEIFWNCYSKNLT